VIVYPCSKRRNFCRWLAVVLYSAGAAELFAESDQKEKQAQDSQSKGVEPVYEPGGDVKPPKLIHYVEPEFSNSSKEAFVEGTVRISTVVTRDGVPTSLRVISGLNAGEDQTAIDAVKQWRFAPGTRNGQPVNVKVTVEVEFHLL
jgi:TonB family protein